MRLAILFIVVFLMNSLLAQNTYVMDVQSSNVMFYIDDNASNDLDLTSSYTIEFWVYVDSSRPSGSDKLMQRGADGTTGYYWEINEGDGSDNTHYQLKLHTYKDNGSGAENSYVATPDISCNEWHFVSFTYDESVPRLLIHVDGTRVKAIGNSKFQLPASDQPLHFFAGSNSYNPFEGRIDELRISNTNRHGWNDYTVSTTDPPFSDDANTVLLYHFDDNTELPPLSSASNFTFTHHNGRPSDGNRAITSSNYVSVSNLPLPVELTSFTASVSGSIVELNWQTATEINNSGFEIERRNVNNDWQKIGFVEGAGNSNSPREYSFTDNVGKAGNFSYRLKQIDLDGSYKYSNEIEVTIENSMTFELKQNYPNPFNPTTTISYVHPSIAGSNAANVELIVYDALGRKVATLVNKEQTPGNYSVQFNAGNLPSGLYFYRLSYGNLELSRKMLLLK